MLGTTARVAYQSTMPKAPETVSAHFLERACDGGGSHQRGIENGFGAKAPLRQHASDSNTATKAEYEPKGQRFAVGGRGFALSSSVGSVRGQHRRLVDKREQISASKERIRTEAVA